jgi:protein-disulfide isomerase
MNKLESQNRPKPWRSRWAFVPMVLLATSLAWLTPETGLWSAGRDMAVAAEAGGKVSKQDFEQRVRDYLLDHPEVVAEALSRLEARERERAAKQAQNTLKAHTDEVFRASGDPVSGNPNGDITVVEFFDYNCPYCKQMAPIMTKAESDDSQLRVVYKEFPILGPDSLLAAKVALAAKNQGKYVAYHRAIYQTRGHVGESTIFAVAKSVGMDIARLKADMQSADIVAQIDRNLRLGQALGINGTPGFVIGDRVFTGATDLQSLQKTIAAAREKSATNK